MLFCFFFLTFATRRVRLTWPNPTQISHAKGDEERKHKATNSNRLTPATAKLQCNDGMFDDGDGELQPLVQRQQQDDAPATRHPAPAHQRTTHASTTHLAHDERMAMATTATAATAKVCDMVLVFFVFFFCSIFFLFDTWFLRFYLWLTILYLTFFLRSSLWLTIYDY